MTKKIVVVGSINLDLVASVSRLPRDGETIPGESFATHFGGKGANQAVCVARLGGEVAMVGRVGGDSFGDQLRSGLERAGVDTSCVLAVDGPSGTAMILVNRARNNAIVVVPGANGALHQAGLEQHEDTIGDASMILSQLEIPLGTVEELGVMAARLKIPFMLDPAPAQALSSRLLKTVTWLTPNESETLALLHHLGHACVEGLAGEEAIGYAATQILAAGVMNVALKLGSRGVYVKGQGLEGKFIAPFAVQAVDTTAAGDAFNGGFAYALTGGMAPVRAARFASAVAAISVTRDGAQASMPNLSEVQQFLRDHASKTGNEVD